MIVTETLLSNSLAREVDMPIIYAIDMKKKLEDMGAQIKENSLLTSGPRAMFKFAFYWKNKINDYSYTEWNIKINGEFTMNTNRGTVEISYNIDIVSDLPDACGFMTSCLNRAYKDYFYNDVIKYAKEDAKDILEKFDL